MSVLENVETYIKNKYPCCAPVLRGDELLINQPHASISSVKAHKAWLKLEDKLVTKYKGITVQRIRHQIHVTTTY